MNAITRNRLGMDIAGKTITVAIGVASLVGVAGVDRATAAHVTNSGCTGPFTVPVQNGLKQYSQDTITMNPFVVYQAFCSTGTQPVGTQTVTVVYRMWGNGANGWALYRTETKSIGIPVGYHA